MIITICWSADGKNNGAVERVESPYVDGWADWWIAFDGNAEDGFYVSVKDNVEEIRLAPSMEDRLEAYMDWLDENVDVIKIDDCIWWQSSRELD